MLQTSGVVTSVWRTNAFRQKKAQWSRRVYVICFLITAAWVFAVVVKSILTLSFLLAFGMAQMSWVYLDNQGGRHRVGLYHGDQSGHLVIHCNMRVVQIDFSIKETKTYSFFIEDELCEVTLEKMANGRFGYGFEVNKKVDTPRNRIRRADERHNRYLMAWFVGGFVGLLLLLFVGLRWYGHEQRKKQMSLTSLFSNLTEESALRLGQEGKNAETQMIIVQETQQRKVYYAFVTADSTRVSGNFAVADTGQVLLPNGFPLKDRDAFAVRYLSTAPKVYRVDFNQPIPATILEYLSRAIAAEQIAHPDQLFEHNRCLVQTAFSLNGWQSLGHFISQHQTPKQNARFNRDSYLRFIRDPTFSRAVQKECW